MKRYTVVFVALAVVVLVCSGSLVVSAGSNASNTGAIRIWDNCDPKTFNDAFGDGTCLHGQHGTERLPIFLGELTVDRVAGAWRFGSRTYTITSGETTSLDNRGGELHTFTTVKKYGGGFVPILNQLSGTPVPAPECLQDPSDSNIFVEAGTVEVGPVAGSSTLPVGTTRVQCCIHPWMRTAITVK